MLNIDKDIYLNNLTQTKAYCSNQLKLGIEDYSIVLRSLDIVYNNQRIFDFKEEKLFSLSKPYVKKYTSVKWSIDLTYHSSIINNLFIEQLKYKNIWFANTERRENATGKVLVTEVDCTVIDGASEAESQGVIDAYDLPPIDCWFYMLETRITRLLFSWIPEQLVDNVEQGIQVNPVDCFNWFETIYPKEFAEIKHLI